MHKNNTHKKITSKPEVVIFIKIKYPSCLRKAVIVPVIVLKTDICAGCSVPICNSSPDF